VILILLMKLWQADLTVPLHYGSDSLQVMAWIKGLVDNGWYLHNDTQGAPLGMDLYDFPSSDLLHWLALKGIALAVPNHVVAFNLYFLLGFPLATLAALFVFRRLRMPYAPATVLALLFAFQPYHFLRGPWHLFLCAYFLVPIMVLVVLRLYRGERTLWHFDEQQERTVLAVRNRSSVWTALFCLVFASAGVYYTFFACFFLAVAGTAAALGRRSIMPLGAAAVLIGVLGAGFLANLTPSLAYWYQHGRNRAAVPRQAFETEFYGLKIAQLLLPVDGHRWGVLARLKQRYSAPPLPCVNENTAATLGMIGSAGFLYLLGRMALGRRGRQGTWLDSLAILTLSGLLLATVGGFGSLFSLLVSPLIRTPNRISIYLGFFALAAVGLLLTRAAARVHSPLSRCVWYGALAMLLVVGLIDQTPRSTAPPYASLQEAYRRDEVFVRRLETALPAGAMIFQIPYVAYVEHSPVHEMVSYGHLQGYLHSQSLRWSYGAMQGREGDRWQKAVAALPPPQLIRELTAAGFGALWIDRRGYPDHGRALEISLGGLLGATPLISEDDQRSVFLLPHKRP